MTLDKFKAKKKQAEKEAIQKTKINIDKEPKLVFPTDAFPKRISDIIKCFAECYGFPVDYFGLGVLMAASSAIGNAYNAEYKYKFVATPILYGSIVGNASIGKTHVLNMCLSPIFRLEEKFREKQTAALQEWKQAAFEVANSNIKGEKEPPKPIPNEILINDATIEAINYSLSHNPRGLLYFKDELSGWVNSLNQYRKGSDTEFWLSNWSNVTIKVSRASKEPLYIKKPFINVFGALTPSFLEQMASGGRADNGFLARIIFAYPDDMKKPYPSDITPDESVFKTYAQIIEYIYKLPNNINRAVSEIDDPTIESIVLKLNDKAKAIYKQFLFDNTDNIREAEDDKIKSIYGKMDSYCLRFSLILELLELASSDFKSEPLPLYSTVEEIEQIQIQEKSVLNAIKLCEYFKKTAFKVIQRFESPVRLLPREQQLFYEALPDIFTRKEAENTAKETKLKISTSTIKRLLNNHQGVKSLFKKLGRGEYEKRFL